MVSPFVIFFLYPICTDMILYTGLKMDIHGEAPDTVYADCICANCDTPAAHKFNSTVGHSHDFQPCPYCKIFLVDSTRSKSTWLRSSGIMMLICPRCCGKGWLDPSQVCIHIQESCDTKSTGCDLPGQWHLMGSIQFNLRLTSIIQDHVGLHAQHISHCMLPMYAYTLPNAQLGLIAHFFMHVIFKFYMLSGMGGANSPKQCFENIINSIQWPSHVTQLPKNISNTLISPSYIYWANFSAQQKSIIQEGWWVVPLTQSNPCHSLVGVARWEWQYPSWWTSYPLEYQGSIHPGNCHATYAATLKMCAGFHILASWAISMACGQVGQDFLDQYCLALKQLGNHTMIDHHLSCHYLKFIKGFGPVYGWWLYVFEWFNGMLEKVKLNGMMVGIWNWL
jgi:hypothetical protein